MLGLVSEFDYILTVLATSMKANLRVGPQAGVVLLLGAGCSKQYGLPTFRELLLKILQQDLKLSVDSQASLEVLRDQLEEYWAPQGPDARRNILKRHLTKPPMTCPAYCRIARLAKTGFIKAIVNLNFDELLERELRREELAFKVSTTFRAYNDEDRTLIVYKPHGTLGEIGIKPKTEKFLHQVERMVAEAREFLYFDRDRLASIYHLLSDIEQDPGWTPEIFRSMLHEIVGELKTLRDAVETDGGHAGGLITPILSTVLRVQQINMNWAKNELVLDIASGDLFADPDEDKAAQRLLSGNHIISIGYSGVDAKIAAALRSFAPSEDPRDSKLYFVNLNRPDPRIRLAMARRASENLCLAGEDAGFENFLERLCLVLGAEHRVSSLPPQVYLRPYNKGGILTRRLGNFTTLRKEGTCVTR